MKNVSRLPSERYECVSCDKEFVNEDVQDTWSCPNCNEPVYIYAKDEESETKIVLIRVTASEIKTDNIIHLPFQLTGEAYRVLGVNKLARGQLGIGLEGYGQYKCSEDQPINQRIGGWL